MSHFTVAVITEDIGELERLMEPYYEGLETDPRVDMTKQELIDEHKALMESIKTGESKYLVERDKEENLLGMTQEEFSKWYHGGTFDEEGNLLTTYNPNSKWDWYVVGGRWKNLLKLKDGSRADYAKIKDIDFSPDMVAYKEAERFWEIVVEGQPLKEGEEAPFNLYKEQYYLDLYGTKERYAEMQSKFLTFALINEGEWYEKGQMGWFGMSNATKESSTEFEELFDKAIKNANPEHYLVIVDCHI